MHSLPSVSVIVPYLNVDWCIEDQLKALREQDYKGTWELILVDNGSNDRSNDVISRCISNYPVNVTHCKAFETKSASYARNIGIDRSEAELLCFCDADDRVDSSWITELVNHHVPLALVSGANRSWDGTRSQNGNKAWCPGAKPHLGGPPMGMGSNFLISRADMVGLGGFDTAFVYGEDAELSWRFQTIGGKVVPAFDALIDYRDRSGFWANFKTQFKHGLYDIKLIIKYEKYVHIDRSYNTFPKMTPPIYSTLQQLTRGVNMTPVYLYKFWGKYLGHVVGRLKSVK